MQRECVDLQLHGGILTSVWLQRYLLASFVGFPVSTLVFLSEKEKHEQSQFTQDLQGLSMGEVFL